MTSSGSTKASLLIDGAVQCYPDNELYFTTDEEAYPRIEIDLKENRIVLGITVYFRDDVNKPNTLRKNYVNWVTHITIIKAIIFRLLQHCGCCFKNINY